MKEKDWLIPFTRPLIPRALLDAGYTPLLASVLALRGITDAAEADARINSGEDCLYDPLLIRGMAEAKERVLRAIAARETVAVYGDYDVDGITATCLVTDYLRNKGLRCYRYIPDRSEEGYGLNCSALDNLKKLGVTLLVTVDCGITAVEEAEYAAALGIDMVITDHHECRSDALPRVCALIDCKQDGDTYPNKALAGVGMALKLVCACEGGSREMLDRYADLVAIGTVADVMPLVGENRYLVRRGLEQLSASPRPGIAAMLSELPKVSATTIGFSLAPRLNAAGRLGKAATAAELLMCENRDKAEKLAQELTELNRQRQSIETEIWQEASAMISGKPDAPIVLASDKWHQGVIGIAASRLSEQYSLPSVMICLNGDVGKGSCRSYGGFNLYEALSACSEHLIGFGGHALAAGLNIRREKLDDFRAALTAYFHNNRPEPIPEISCDLLITDGKMLSIENVRSLDLLEPYGNQNPKPVLCMSGALLESASNVGSGKHLRMRVRLGTSAFDAIFFSHTLEECDVREGERVDVAFTPQVNEYHGSVSVQLVVSAVRRHSPDALCSAILSGNEGALWAAVPYCPERSDFVRIWRSLGHGFRVGRSVSAVIRQSLSGMEPEKFCLCLMVLQEVGLLISEGGGIFSAHRAEIEGKADLNATRIISTLRKLG